MEYNCYKIISSFRIQNRINYFKLDETYKVYLVQLPDQFRADQKLKPVVKMLSKCPLNTDKLRAFAISLRKFVPGSDHPLGKEVFPTVQSEPPLAQL